jgi:hypothetical protein
MFVLRIVEFVNFPTQYVCLYLQHLNFLNNLKALNYDNALPALG